MFHHLGNTIWWAPKWLRPWVSWQRLAKLRVYVWNLRSHPKPVDLGRMLTLTFPQFWETREGISIIICGLYTHGPCDYCEFGEQLHGSFYWIFVWFQKKFQNMGPAEQKFGFGIPCGWEETSYCCEGVMSRQWKWSQFSWIFMEVNMPLLDIVVVRRCYGRGENKSISEFTYSKSQCLQSLWSRQ